MEFTPLIITHIVTATAALVFGGITLAMRKGTHVHRLFGRLWVVLMAATALVSFGIQRSGHFSVIHLLSAGSLLALTASIYAVVQGRIHAHRRGMTVTYIALAIAGVFTLLPGRRLGGLLWSAVGLI